MRSRQHRDTLDVVDARIRANVERAIAERKETGRADEDRYGFAARLANATPPVDEAFRLSLRARIQAEASKRNRSIALPPRARAPFQTTNFWRYVLVGVPASAMLVLLLVSVASGRPRLREPGVEVRIPTTPATTVPRLASGDINALADKLNGESAPRTVAVFPGDYASMLAERVQHEVVPLTLGDSRSPVALQSALGAILPPRGVVDVILVSQETTDIALGVRMALERHLYRLSRGLGDTGTDTFGALERITFVAGSQKIPIQPIGAVFEGGIELVAGSALDNLEPGSPLRLALDWQVSEPIDDSLVMFVHLIHDGRRLVAQRDAVPGNGLFPVEMWEPGEQVRDQFALLLPSDLPAGKYEIQAGVYSATTGQRYGLMKPGSGTYVMVQEIAIEE